MSSTFENVNFQSARVSDQITNVLKQAILDGKLMPGDKLPPEEKIAMQFKVSKVTMREALREMETEGLIEKQRGVFGGSYVAEPTLDKIGDSVINCYKFGSLTPEELAEFRQIVEPALLKLAITRRTDEDLKALQSNIDYCENALNQGAPDLSKQIEFHVLLAKACRNRLISSVMEAVTKVFEDIIGKLDLTLQIFRIDLDYSKMFYECLLHHRFEKAQELMVAHFEETKRLIKGSKGKSESDS